LATKECLLSQDAFLSRGCDTRRKFCDDKLAIKDATLLQGTSRHKSKQGSAFRLQGRHFFLTYPRCHLDPQEVLDHFRSGFHVNQVIVAKEDHEDGTPHLHIYLYLSKKFSSRKPDCFDVGVQHGNYQAARCSKAVIDYVKKHGNYLEWVCPSQQSTDGLHKKKTRQQIGQEILQQGRTIQEITSENPQLLFGYQRLKQDIEAYKKDSYVGNFDR